MNTFTNDFMWQAKNRVGDLIVAPLTGWKCGNCGYRHNLPDETQCHNCGERLLTKKEKSI